MPPMAFSPSALLRWNPVSAGSPAPDLSLTADDGTWIKLPDFRTHLHVVLVFFRDGDDAETGAWLKSYNAAVPRFQGLEAAVFGVNTKRTDKLREVRAAPIEGPSGQRPYLECSSDGKFLPDRYS